MYFRVKRTGAYAYLQIVESFREQGQVRQRVLSTVGRLDTLQATGQLDALMRSGLRFCEKLAVIDAHAPDRPKRSRCSGSVRIWSLAACGKRCSWERFSSARCNRAVTSSTSSGPSI